jgi:signal transduction histidine kinase
VGRRLPRSRRGRATLALWAGALAAGLAALALAAAALRGSLPAGWPVAALLAALALGGAAAARSLADREAARVRRALAAGLAHELRTPLAQVRMFTEMLLLRRDRSEDDRTRWLETIEREAHRLGEVVENVLLFAHGDEPDPFPARRALDLGALVEDVATEFAQRAGASAMRIDADPPAGVAVLADPFAIRQAIANLLDNALRFGAPGQTVSLVLEPQRGEAVLRVSDQGPGIPPHRREAVWNPFVRLADGSPAGSGGGLGLAVVRQVVEAHGGRCGIDDAPGGGARVSITLPTIRPALPAALGGREERRPVATS